MNEITVLNIKEEDNKSNDASCKFEVIIKGMDCVSCVTKIESELENSAFILYLNINLITEKMKITVARESDLSLVLTQIENLGFSISEINKIDDNLSNLKLRKIRISTNEENEVRRELKNIPGVFKIEEEGVYNFSNKENNANDNTISKTNKASEFTSIREEDEEEVDKNYSIDNYQYSNANNTQINSFLTLSSQKLADYKSKAKKTLYNIKHTLKSKINTSSNNINKLSKLTIFYDPNTIKSYEILDILSQKQIEFNYINQLQSYIDKIEIKNEDFVFKKFIICFVVTLFNFFFNLLLTGTSFQNFILYHHFITPKLPIHLILSFCLNFSIIYFYGLKIYKKAYTTYKNSRSTGMDTLISLGSLAAFALSLISIYELIIIDGSELDSIKDLSLLISDNIGASAAVVGIYTLGKFMETHAKKSLKNQTASFMSKKSKNKTNIESGSEEESNKYFSQNKFLTVTPLNKDFGYRKEDSRYLDSGLLEHGDMVVLKENDFLLFDVIVRKGEIEVNEGVNYGYDIIVVKRPGDKIKSGSEILKVKSYIPDYKKLNTNNSNTNNKCNDDETGDNHCNGNDSNLNKCCTDKTIFNCVKIKAWDDIDCDDGCEEVRYSEDDKCLKSNITNTKCDTNIKNKNNACCSTIKVNTCCESKADKNNNSNESNCCSSIKIKSCCESNNKEQVNNKNNNQTEDCCSSKIKSSEAIKEDFCCSVAQVKRDSCCSSKSNKKEQCCASKNNQQKEEEKDCCIKTKENLISSSNIISVERVFEECMVYKLTEEMTNAINQKLKFQFFIDRIVKYFVPGILLISTSTFIIWFIIKIFINDKITLVYIAERSISILVVSCPCAFGLAIPIVTSTALKIALEYGILVKNLAVLPEIRNTNKVVFDKTGTLTELITDVSLEYNSEKLPILHIMELLQRNQNHPIGESLYKYSIRNKVYEINKYFNIDNNKDTNINYDNYNNNIDDTLEVEENQLEIIKPSQKQIEDYANLFKQNPILEETEGVLRHNNGISSEISYINDKYHVIIGNENFIKSLNLESNNNTNITDNKIIESLISSNPDVSRIINKLKQEKLLSIYLIANNEIQAIFSLNTFANLRNECNGVIEELKSKYNTDSYILSGDSEDSVEEVGKNLNIPISNLYGNKSAQNKKIILNDLKNNDVNKVLMLGDGINDVLSLTEATYGISFNANSQLNMISSDIIFVKEDLTLLIVLLKLSKYTYVFIWINVFWAFFYNICMIPFTSGLLSSLIDYDISPTMSSLAQLFSDCLIVITASCMKLFIFNEFKKRNNMKTRDELNSEILSKSYSTKRKQSYDSRNSINSKKSNIRKSGNDKNNGNRRNSNIGKNKNNNFDLFMNRNDDSRNELIQEGNKNYEMQTKLLFQ